MVDNLVRPVLKCAASEGLGQILVAGGVACNRRLREVMTSRGNEAGLQVYFPSPAYCTDNAAMIAGLGWHRLVAGERDPWSLDATPA